MNDRSEEVGSVALATSWRHFRVAPRERQRRSDEPAPSRDDFPDERHWALTAIADRFPLAAARSPLGSPDRAVL